MPYSSDALNPTGTPATDGAAGELAREAGAAGAPAPELGATRVLFCTETIRPPLTGVGRYTLQLGRALRDAAGANLGFHPVAPEAPASGPGNRASGRLRAAARQVPGAHLAMDRLREARFARAVAGAGYAIYHEPNYLLRDFDGRRVVTVHDLSHLRHPEYHAQRSRRFLERRLPRSLAGADRIVVPTAFVGRELCALMDVAADRIRVVHEGVTPPPAPLSAERVARGLRDLDLAVDGYMLSVGTLEPRKNLAGLVAAYERLPATTRARFPLVIVGAKGWGHADTDRRIERLRRAGHARVLGFVSDTTLHALYAGASGFAYLSWYEGFGLPPLEAMAAGAPVVTSTAEALVEVTGEAALHAAPGDIDAITGSLRRLLEDAGLRRTLSEHGRTRVRRFSWDRAARQTLAVYAELAG
jgi:alpha-1,3-rhamnosyl/mannosyltransferase